MNIVKKLNKHTIYYFCDNKIKYYINVPHKEFNTTNISLEFLEDTSKFDPEFNDVEWVRSNIIEYYEKVDDDNITLILPILKKEEKENLLSLNINKLNLIERLMALYINSGYITLTKNKINVNKEVFLIENDKFINFIKYFKEKHNSRIIVKRLIEVTDININESEDFIKKEEKNIVEKPFSINENILNEVLNTDIKDKKKKNEEEGNKENNLPNINELFVNKDNKDINKVKENMIENNNDIKTSNPEIKENLKSSKNNLEEKTNAELTKNNIEVSNINKNPIQEVKIPEEKIKVTNTITPSKEKKIEPVNNVINFSDLGSLTAGGLNGALPGNVTINIEKLVTENNEPIKNSKKVEEEIDEVSGLDEDISDIDEFDENEDFDLDAIDVSEAVLSNDDGNKTYRTVTSGGVNFVVGRKDDENLKPIEINKSNSIDLNETKNLKIDMPTNIVKGDDQINKNAGFASYFTLFFVAISAIFIIVYIIVK